MIVVVGIGADGMSGLAPSARTELARATVIYGSRRQLDLLDDSVTAVKRAWPSPMLPALRALLDDAEGDVHVVASGDPLLHGVGNSLIRLYGPDRVAVLPHVSSVTLACSRVGWAVQDTEIISLVTGEPHTAVRRANYVYGSAKAGLDGFCSGLADALHGSGVRLLLVRPGFVIGRMTEGMSPAPFSSTPDQVAAATARALAKGRRAVWVPWILQPVFVGMRLLPQFVWRRMPR